MNSKWSKTAVIAAAIVAAFIAGFAIRGGEAPIDTATDHAHVSIWTCSMHPQIQLPEAGACPICGMDLIPLETGDATSPRSLRLSVAARKLAEVQVATVERRSVQSTLRTVGKLEADETRVREISARVPGRIDKLYIDYTGVPVSAGQALFDLYSPELYSAQQELLQSIGAGKELAKSGIESTRRGSDRTANAARERLRLWGLTAKQVSEIEARGTPSEQVTFVAPTSGIVLHKDAVEGSYVQTGSHIYAIADLTVLWLKLDVYESDLALIRVGQKVTFDTDTHPGEAFTGTVAFIDPVLNERTRSVKVRVNVANPDGRLKPGMFARAVVSAGVDDAGGELPLVIPASAPLVTGKRAIVYVQDPSDAGMYHAREVSLGVRAGDDYVVRSGLEAGELVVTNGAFKLDSALQILAGNSMMRMHGGGTHGTTEDARAMPPVEESSKKLSKKLSLNSEFGAQIDTLLEPYFALSHALSHDDFKTAVAAAGDLTKVLEKVDAAVTAEKKREAWTTSRKPLHGAATAIAEAKDIEAARVHFDVVSKHMIELVKTYGTSGATAVLVYHCPMAFNNRGADWLQFTAGTENPYFGSAMFKCGSQTAVLAEGKQDGGKK